MKRIQVFCDRCGAEIPPHTGQDAYEDSLREAYQIEFDCCLDCLNQIDFASAIAVYAAANGRNQRDVLAEMVRLYEEPE